MLVCVFLCTLAHETAGAACIRLSLRPPFSRGTTKCKPRANHAARRRSCICCLKIESEKRPRRPGQASTASADPGPIHRGGNCFAAPGDDFLSTTQTGDHGSRVKPGTTRGEAI